MKRIAAFFVLALGLAVHAQVSNPSVIYVGSAPAGSCSQSPPVQVLNSSGAIYTCNNGTWAVQGGGGGDTITSPNSTLTVGGTASNTTLDFNLSNPNTWAGAQTFVAPLLGTPASGVITNLSGTCAGCTVGTATTATNATNVASVTTSANATLYCALFAANSSSNQAVDVSAACTLNPSTGNVTFTGGVTGTSFTGTGATPAALALTAGTGSIPALPANSAGFAAPASGGTSFLYKLPATGGVGILHAAAVATADGVAESALTSSAVNLAGGSNEVTGALPIGNVGSAGLSGTSPVTIASTGAIACATCVTSASSLTSTAIMTGGGSQGSQTASPTSTMDSSGNMALAGTLKLGTAPTVTTPGTGFYDFGTDGTEPASIGAGTSGFVMDSTGNCPIQWNNASNVGCSAALAATETFSAAQTFTGGIVNSTTPVRDTTRFVLAANMTAVSTAGVNIGSTGGGNSTFSWPVTAANWYDMECKLPVTFVTSATIKFQLVSISGSVTVSNVNSETVGNTGASAAFQDLPTIAGTTLATSVTPVTGAPGNVSEQITYSSQFLTSHAGNIGLEFVGNGANNVQMLLGGQCGLTQIN